MLKEAPEPYLAMNENELSKLNLKPGEEIKIEIGEEHLVLKIKLKNDLADGIVGLPVGLFGMPYLILPAFIKIQK